MYVCIICGGCPVPHALDSRLLSHIANHNSVVRMKFGLTYSSMKHFKHSRIQNRRRADGGKNTLMTERRLTATFVKSSLHYSRWVRDHTMPELKLRAAFRQLRALATTTPAEGVSALTVQDIHTQVSTSTSLHLAHQKVLLEPAHRTCSRMLGRSYSHRHGHIRL